MRNSINLRLATISAGVAAGLLGLTIATAPALAQNYGPNPGWNGAPNATGPATGPAETYGYNNGPFFGAPFFGAGPSAPASVQPNYGGFAPEYNGNNVGPHQPFWLGAPQAIGPT